MENLDNRMSVNRDVIPPGSLPTGDPEWAFVSTPRHGKFIRAKNARTPCGAGRSSHRGIGDRSKRRSERVENLFPLSTIGDRRFVSISEKSNDSVIFPAGRFDIIESWEAGGKMGTAWQG